MKVCVFQWPNGASASKRTPRPAPRAGHLRRRRVRRFARTNGARHLTIDKDKPVGFKPHPRLTAGHPRIALPPDLLATAFGCDQRFFIRVSFADQEPGKRGGAYPDAVGLEERPGQFGHRDIRFRIHPRSQKERERRQLTLPWGPAGPAQSTP